MEAEVMGITNRLAGAFVGAGPVWSGRRRWPSPLPELRRARRGRGFDRCRLAAAAVVLASCTSATPAPTTVPWLPPPEVPEPEFVLEGYLDQISVRDNLGAAMLAVIDNGQARFVSRGTDPGGASLTPDSSVRIGGVAAVFAELTTLVLADQGTVDLERDVADYLIAEPVPAGVTVGDLIEHVVGVPDYAMSIETTERMRGIAAAWTPAQAIDVAAGRILRLEEGLRITFPVGQTQLLGRVIEEATGLSLGEAITTTLIDPLALSSTYVAGYGIGSEPLGGFTSGGAAFDSVVPADYRKMSWTADTWTAGGLISTASDLHTVFSAAYGGGLLSPESMAVWTRPRGPSAASPTHGRTSGYGHEIPGSTMLVLHAPDTSKTAVLVLTTDAAYYDLTIPAVSRFLTTGG